MHRWTCSSLRSGWSAWGSSRPLRCCHVSRALGAAPRSSLTVTAHGPVRDQGVGNDPFREGDGLASELEAFGSALPRSSLVVLQQRSPAAPGLQQASAAAMLRWLEQSAAEQARSPGRPHPRCAARRERNACCGVQVVVLGSLDAIMRRDAELQAAQLLYLATPRRLANCCEQLQWRRLQVCSRHALHARRSLGHLCRSGTGRRDAAVRTQGDLQQLCQAWNPALPPWPLWQELEGQPAGRSRAAHFCGGW